MRILDLTVQNVRGLQKLQLHFDGRNAVIWGPNGAGKSCVVDAIDFLITGRISRLMGQGTAGISLARHGPHIDHDVESAIVTATVQFEELSENVELSRCIAQPDILICPDDALDPLAKMKDLMRRGGVALTRRDILRYVAAEAGKRADEIEELLHLEDVDEVRSSFRRARTELNRNVKAAAAAVETAKSEVNVTLGLATYSDEGLLKIVNSSRQLLGGLPLEVQESNRFREGIVAPGVSDTVPPSSNFNLLQQAIQSIRRGAPTGVMLEIQDSDKTLRNGITSLRNHPELFDELERLELTQHASRFVDDSTVECPVCGASWTEGELKEHIDAKIATAHAAKIIQKNITESADLSRSLHVPYGQTSMFSLRVTNCRCRICGC